MVWLIRNVPVHLGRFVETIIPAIIVVAVIPVITAIPVVAVLILAILDITGSAYIIPTMSCIEQRVSDLSNYRTKLTLGITADFKKNIANSFVLQCSRIISNFK